MKKVLSLALVLVLAVVCFAACSKAPAETNYKLGMGVSVSLTSSKTGTAQVDATVATVLLDSNGKIVDCKLDVAQNKTAVTDGTLPESVTFKTKVEKGDAYNMRGSSGIGKEWFEQAEFFANYVTGKTGAEVKAIATETNSSGHVVATDATILAGCTMDISEFIEAIGKACDDVYAKSFTATGDVTLSLAAITELDSSSKAATAEKDGSANMYTNFAATATDKDGKILAVIVDMIQPKVAFNVAGEITTDTANTTVLTKREKHDDYGMKDRSEIGKEWWEQANAFEAFIVGKTATEVAAVDASDATLAAGCTIKINEFMATVALAMNGYNK